MKTSPLRYPGGKGKLAKFIESLVVENNVSVYVEPFCGGASIAIDLLIKGIVKKVILNDFDWAIYNFWKVIIEDTDDFICLMNETPITIEEWYRQKEIYSNWEDHTDLEIAFATFFLNRTNRSGIIEKAGPIGGKTQSGSYKIDCRFNKKDLEHRIRVISSYSDSIELYNLNATDLIDKVIKKRRGLLIYFDPPYYQKGRELYSDFLLAGDHEYLAEKIGNDLTNYKWVITYDSLPATKKLYCENECHDYSLTYSLQQKKKAVELIIFSNNLHHSESDHLLQYID